VLVLSVWAAARVAGQTLTVKTAGAVLRVKAAGLRFVEGSVLDRLRDGRTTRVDFELAVMGRPKGPALARDRQTFNMSLDLWEERFAVSRVGTTSRSISHLQASEAEAWCVDALGVPLSALGRADRAAQFWIRLEYQIPDPEAAADAGGEGLSLRGLIEILSRKRQTTVTKSIEAGPFHLFN
jgi:hypothetical protein